MGGTEGIWRTWGRWGVVALGGTARTRWHLRGHSGDMVGWWHSGGVWGRSEDVGTPWGSSTCGAWWHRGALALMGHKVGGRHQLRPRSPASAAPPMGGQSGGRRCQWAPPHPPLCPPPLCAPHPTHLRDADPRQRLHGAGQFCDHVEDLCWQPPHPDFPGAPGHHRDPTRPQQRLRHRLGHLTPKTVLLSSKFTPQQSPTPAGDPTAPSGTPRAAPSRSSHPKRPLIPL